MMSRSAKLQEQNKIITQTTAECHCISRNSRPGCCQLIATERAYEVGVRQNTAVYFYTFLNFLDFLNFIKDKKNVENNIKSI